MIPIMADVFLDRLPGSSTVIVISPLKALMKDQVKYLNDKTGIPAIALIDMTDQQQDEAVTRIEEGVYGIVYTSPETFLSMKRWRNLASSSSFRNSCVALVVDEAHCLVQWGTSESNASPFRHWYGKIIELKSILSSTTQLAIFTATATESTKFKIFEMLQLSRSGTFCLEKNPVRSNIIYIFQQIEKDKAMKDIFSPIIEELRQEKGKTSRTVLFCQTRKHCAILYRVFSMELGNAIYANEDFSPESRYVDMFHAGTPDSVKSHIIQEMGNANSHLRVLICTIAFGMGVDCKGLHRSIHFGPSKSIEAVLQETGRLGRDGKESIAYILYNGMLCVNCDREIKHLALTEECRRREIGKHFASSLPSNLPKGCECCDNCSRNCNCDTRCSKGGPKYSLLSRVPETQNQPISFLRSVSKDQKTMLKSKLKTLKDNIAASLAEIKPVGIISVKCEFDQFQVKQILAASNKIASLNDIMSLVEIWRKSHAIEVLKIFQETFRDFDIEDGILDCAEDDFEDIEELHEDWDELQEDISVFNSTTSSMLHSEF
eukprot:Seg483.13 transcript_id=Seg483.13/GoldUCD/mRNA.D3Y31 product="ATP-dependent DNA helicase Q-like 1" protein_id=Seg483.13/GoldUCD/D3Y31